MDVDLLKIETNISKHLENTNNIFGVHLRYLLENIYKSSVFLFIIIVLCILSCITGVSEVEYPAEDLIEAVQSVNISYDDAETEHINHLSDTTGETTDGDTTGAPAPETACDLPTSFSDAAFRITALQLGDSGKTGQGLDVDGVCNAPNADADEMCLAP